MTTSVKPTSRETRRLQTRQRILGAAIAEFKRSGMAAADVGAIVDAVEESLHELGAKPLRREGKSEGRWVLIDFGEIVVHVQHAEDRTYYALERLWKDCPVIELPADVHGTSEAGE